MLEASNTALVIVDVQEKLTPVMHEKDKLLDSLRRLISGAQVLELPIVLTEQNPAGLGPTVPEISQLLSGVEPITKFSFSCCGEDGYVKELAGLGRKQFLVAGIETHVCVYQTVVDMVGLGYEVQVVEDAVSSRASQNKEVGLDRMKCGGASLTTTEIAQFELLKVAEGPKFKEILKIVR